MKFAAIDSLTVTSRILSVNHGYHNKAKRFLLAPSLWLPPIQSMSWFSLNICTTWLEHLLCSCWSCSCALLDCHWPHLHLHHLLLTSINISLLPPTCICILWISSNILLHQRWVYLLICLLSVNRVYCFKSYGFFKFLILTWNNLHETIVVDQNVLSISISLLVLIVFSTSRIGTLHFGVV